MSRKIGRNEPCPCGSGKKYKRCCLESDEAAARDRARQQMSLDDAAGDGIEFDEYDKYDEYDDDEAGLDRDDEALLLDVRDITSVCYTRGFVNTLADLRAGRGVRVTEWQAPQIPQAVLDSITNEGLDTLEGCWGNPKVGDPIQVDIIDLETEAEVISIEVFNRGISLVNADSEGMRQIHRACGALEAAASGRYRQGAPLGEAKASIATIEGTSAKRATGESATAENVDIERVQGAPSSASDLTAVLKKAHRRQGGTCALCGNAVTRVGASKHLGACAPAHDAATGSEQPLVRIRATAPGRPAYWLDVEVKADATLGALDAFLRKIWLECCGHLSAFDMGVVKYFSRGYDFGFTRGFGGFGGHRIEERSMNARVRDALPPGGGFDYEYDFGSTTTLRLSVAGERTGRLGRSTTRLLARNTPPVWPCAMCGDPASLVCPYCLHEGTAFVCARHQRQHHCGEAPSFLPVVNSPRVGVCGYTGE